MTKRILLWLNAFFACGFFTGHLFDYMVIIPNWNDGNVVGITKFREFFITADPGAYFMIFALAPVLFAIICFFAYLKSDKGIKKMLGAYLIISLGLFISYLAIFHPINEYLFFSKEINFEPVKTKELISKWVMSDTIRLVIGFFALLVSARVLHLSYQKVTS